MKKKTRKELAREIIENLRRGMNRPIKTETASKNPPEAPAFTPMPLVRSRRSGQLQTSHSH